MRHYSASSPGDEGCEVNGPNAQPVRVRQAFA
jgi:hypothetical protein